MTSYVQFKILGVILVDGSTLEELNNLEPGGKKHHAKQFTESLMSFLKTRWTVQIVILALVQSSHSTNIMVLTETQRALVLSLSLLKDNH